MARNGSGTYSLYTPGNPVVAGTDITDSWANNTLSDIATALTQSIASDGQTPITADIPWNGKKITGLGAATGSGDALSYGGAINGTTGTFSGAVSGTTGTFSGAVSGTTGTFSGAVSGTTGTFSGAVSGTSLALSAQPAFLAYRSSLQTIVATGTVVFNTTAFNVGSGYNTTTGVFTVPSGQGGLYAVQTGVIVSQSSGSTQPAYLNLAGTGGTVKVMTEQYFVSSVEQAMNISTVLQLSEGDTVYVQFATASATFNVVYNPNGSTSNKGAYFSAVKIG